MDFKETQKLLDEKIPRDVISQRSAGGNKKLDYLESWYVIDRLNKIFGALSWSSETLEMKLVSADNARPAYIAKVRIAVRLPENQFVFHDGYGFGSDKSDLNPHEMAVKEAESDAFKRAAKNFGMSLGLALYDKTQENVTDEEPIKSAVRQVVTAKEPAPVPGITASSDAVSTGSGDDSKELLALITKYAKVADAKKKLTLEAFKSYYKEKYQVERTDKLNVSQMRELVTYLKSIV